MEQDIPLFLEGSLREIPIPQLLGKSVRYLQTKIGTEWRDLINTEMWTMMAINQIVAYQEQGYNVVVDDLRFPHEYNLLLPRQSEFWYVERENRPIDAMKIEDIAIDLNRFDLKNLEFNNMLTDLLLECLLNCCEGEKVYQKNIIFGGKTESFIKDRISCDLKAIIHADWNPIKENTNQHISEQGLPKNLFSLHFFNNSQKEDLYTKIENQFSHLDSQKEQQPVY